MMNPRMTQPVMVLPDAMAALSALATATQGTGLPHELGLMVELRASQLSGCSFCVGMHARDMRKAGESDERLFGIAAWRDSPHFTEAERAAPGLTEAVTRLGDPADPVPDEVWATAAQHFDEPALAALLLKIGMINLWNRLNIATRQVAGSWTG